MQVKRGIRSREEGQGGTREKAAAFLPRQGRTANKRAGKMCDLMEQLNAQALDLRGVTEAKWERESAGGGAKMEPGHRSRGAPM